MNARIVEPELLDEIDIEDPRAIRSRKDLRRVNRWMLNGSIVAKALAGHRKGRVLEIGCGDGSLMLAVAKRSSRSETPIQVTLVDRQNLINHHTSEALSTLGWMCEPVVADVFEFLTSYRQVRFDVVVANLFLHHFKQPELSHLLNLLSTRADLVIACEPRRSGLALLGSRTLWAIGCNEVTRYDASVSVRSGFNGRELSTMWPKSDNWILEEGRAGLFSHRFLAKRTQR